MSQASGAELLETACDRERVAILFNPASGIGDSAGRRTRLEALARAAGLTCELAETDRDHGAAPLARQAVADGMERVLVAGGDGSVAEAANVLAGTGVALAVVPGGTGNLFALNLGLPTDAEAALHLALTGEARPLDVGRANGHVFLVAAGMGLDARMVQDADRASKDRLGVLAYVVAIIRNLRRPPIRYSITIDGRRLWRRAITVLVANLGRVPGGLELVPGCDPEDGLLEVAVLRAQSLWELASLAGRRLMGRPSAADPGGNPLLEVYHGREIVIETGTPQPMQLDGNLVGHSRRMQVRVEPGALRLVRAPVAPAGSGLLAAVPVALSRGAGLAVWPLVAAAGSSAAFYLGARVLRARGRRLKRLLRRPLWAGMAVGALVQLLTRRGRGGAAEEQGEDLEREASSGGDEPGLDSRP